MNYLGKTISNFTHLLGVFCCAAALLMSSGLYPAQGCQNNGKVTLGNEETLAHAYQPLDGDILHRYRFVPAGPPPPSGKYPTVLLLPPDIFKLPYGDNGVPTELQAALDLQLSGFLVFTVDHRLAPPGALYGQILGTASGRFPQQTDDIKRQIIAALADPQCNGSIYLIGGSGGGTLALWVMLDSAGIINLNWSAARASIKAVVSLSGPTKFCDWNNPGGISCATLVDFENDVENYVGVPPSGDCLLTQGDCVTLDPASPAWLAANGATSSPPVRLYGTDSDPVPWVQEQDMLTALKGKFPSLDAIFYQMHYATTDRANHAFNYWHETNNASNGNNECVSQQVIEFLQSFP